MRHIFLMDPHNVWLFSGMERAPGMGEKSPGEALFGEGYFQDPPRLFEPRIDNGYPNVFYDKDFGIYRCYYTGFIEDPCSSAHSLADRKSAVYEPRSDRLTGLFYAASRNGIHWEKPPLHRVEFQGNWENNILFQYVHGASVLLDTHETDPQKRYKMAMKHDLFGEMAVSFSADGLDWCDPIPWPEHNPAGDTHNFAFWDPKTENYKLITRTWDGVRISSLCESEDFLRWSQPMEIMRGSGMDDQIYSMPVFSYGDLWFGLPSIYHGGDRAGKSFDLVDCELAFSHDLNHWERACPGQALIPRSPGQYGDGVFDCGCIYASAPVFEEGRAVIYYMGGNGPHTNFRESSLGRFVIDPDKLAGWRTKPGETGWLLTRNLQLGDRLLLAADLPDKGALRAAVCEPVTNLYLRPKALPGFGFEDFAPAGAEDGKLALCWSEPLSALKGKRCCLLLEVQDGTLYTLISH